METLETFPEIPASILPETRLPGFPHILLEPPVLPFCQPGVDLEPPALPFCEPSYSDSMLALVPGWEEVVSLGEDLVKVGGELMLKVESLAPSRGVMEMVGQGLIASGVVYLTWKISKGWDPQLQMKRTHVGECGHSVDGLTEISLKEAKSEDLGSTASAKQSVTELDPPTVEHADTHDVIDQAPPKVQTDPVQHKTNETDVEGNSKEDVINLHIEGKSQDDVTRLHGVRKSQDDVTDRTLVCHGTTQVESPDCRSEVLSVLTRLGETTCRLGCMEAERDRLRDELSSHLNKLKEQTKTSVETNESSHQSIHGEDKHRIKLCQQEKRKNIEKKDITNKGDHPQQKNDNESKHGLNDLNTQEGAYIVYQGQKSLKNKVGHMQHNCDRSTPRDGGYKDTRDITRDITRDTRRDTREKTQTLMDVSNFLFSWLPQKLSIIWPQIELTKSSKDRNILHSESPPKQMKAKTGRKASMNGRRETLIDCNREQIVCYRANNSSVRTWEKERVMTVDTRINKDSNRHQIAADDTSTCQSSLHFLDNFGSQVLVDKLCSLIQGYQESEELKESEESEVAEEAAEDIDQNFELLDMPSPENQTFFSAPTSPYMDAAALQDIHRSQELVKVESPEDCQQENGFPDVKNCLTDRHLSTVKTGQWLMTPDDLRILNEILASIESRDKDGCL